MPSSMLDHAGIWTELVARLNGHAGHDAKMVVSFSQAFDIPPHEVLAKLRTYVHPATSAAAH